MGWVSSAPCSKGPEGAGLGWDLGDLAVQTQLPPGKLLQGSFSFPWVSPSTVPGTGMSHVTPSIAASATGGWHKQHILGQLPSRRRKSERQPRGIFPKSRAKPPCGKSPADQSRRLGPPE